jgi:hypothetical protein
MVMDYDDRGERRKGRIGGGSGIQAPGRLEAGRGIESRETVEWDRLTDVNIPHLCAYRYHRRHLERRTD